MFTVNSIWFWFFCLSYVLATLFNAMSLLHKPIGIQTMSLATIKDIVVWVILAIANAFSLGYSTLQGLYTLLLTIAFIFVYSKKSCATSFKNIYGVKSNVFKSNSTVFECFDNIKKLIKSIFKKKCFANYQCVTIDCHSALEKNISRC